ncbi:MAG: DnaJ C-terminal domain-containing protein [Kofleriaceae bacterium]
MAPRRRRDYYEVLGLDKRADDVEIKRAYRDLARRYHPDLNPTGVEQFKEINEAYAVLSDARERTRYDRFGHADDPGGGFGSVVDAVEDVISGLRRRRGKQRGRDLRYTLEISFEEAVFGCTRAITVPVEPGAAGGPTREFSVAIPAGTKEGGVKVLHGDGEPGRGGAAAGDLHVIVRVKPHPVFRREGVDVLSDVAVTVPEAALGAVVEVATVDGPVKMRIPEGTQSGKVFRLRGRGVPRGPGKHVARGDHLARVAVTTPTSLTARQRELLEEFARTLGSEIAARPVERKGLIDRMRDLLDG